MKNFILRDNAVRERALNYIASLPLEPLLEIEVIPYEETRNSRQNKLYWAILNEIAELTGKPSEAWHWFFKKRFIGFDEIEICGEIQIVPHSTTRLKKKKFAEYVTRIEVYVTSDLGINLYRLSA